MLPAALDGGIQGHFRLKFLPLEVTDRFLYTERGPVFVRHSVRHLLLEA